MRIGIIGGTGNAGRALCAEAVRRGHAVTALVRDPENAKTILAAEVTVVAKDAFDIDRADLLAFDAVIDAFSTPPPRAYQHVDLAARLIGLLRETDIPRVVFILGAGSLATGADNHLLVEDLRRTPGAETWIATPENQLEELRFLRGVDNVNWVGVSPSQTFAPGDATTFTVGGNELLVAADGMSRVTTGTMAVAILDEIENPRHSHERFTVRND